MHKRKFREILKIPYIIGVDAVLLHPAPVELVKTVEPVWDLETELEPLEFINRHLLDPGSMAALRHSPPVYDASCFPRAAQNPGSTSHTAVHWPVCSGKQ